MRFPRMTTRRWMVVVAVVALLTACAVGAWRLNRLSSVHQQQAAIFANEEALWIAAEEGHVHHLVTLSGKPATNADMVRYYRALKEKYERAARYPWSSVEPDPPKPEWPPEGQ